MRQHFSKWGITSDVYFPGVKGQKRLNYCFITFDNQTSAERACNERTRILDGWVGRCFCGDLLSPATTRCMFSLCAQHSRLTESPLVLNVADILKHAVLCAAAHIAQTLPMAQILFICQAISAFASFTLHTLITLASFLNFNHYMAHLLQHLGSISMAEDRKDNPQRADHTVVAPLAPPPPTSAALQAACWSDAQIFPAVWHGCSCSINSSLRQP